MFLELSLESCKYRELITCIKDSNSNKQKQVNKLVKHPLNKIIILSNSLFFQFHTKYQYSLFLFHQTKVSNAPSTT